MYGIAGLLTGRTLAGRYLIEAVIGRGGMGAVYRGIDERLSRPVAVKVIGASTNDPAEHARLRARFHREARAAAALHHPNVVSVHDFGTDAELQLDFLVMELLRGEDLSVRLVRGGALAPHVALSILRQAARGLAAGHRAGMVHRDVKPGNLFLEVGDHPDEPRVRVLDFGIAQVGGEGGTLTHLTEYGRSPFSPAYASPEQSRGEEGVGPASDVFSLAAVGYHMLTGERPFTSGDPDRAARELAESVPRLRERVPGLDARLHVALVKALSPRAADRFRDAAFFADALGAPGTSPPPQPAAAPTNARPAPRPSPYVAVSEWEEEDDHTQFLAPPPAEPRPAPAPQPALRAAASQPQQQAPARMPMPAPSVAHPQPAPAASPIPAPAPMPSAAQAGQMPEPPRRPGRVRRFFRAVWELTLTTAALALFAGAWAAAVQGVLDDNRQQLIAGGLATMLFTPWAIHRLTGRRGRYGFALFASVIGTGVALRYVGMEQDPLILVGAAFGLQVMGSFFMAWLTRRKERVPVQPQPYA